MLTVQCHSQKSHVKVEVSRTIAWDLMDPEALVSQGGFDQSARLTMQENSSF